MNGYSGPVIPEKMIAADDRKQRHVNPSDGQGDR